MRHAASVERIAVYLEDEMLAELKARSERDRRSLSATVVLLLDMALAHTVGVEPPAQHRAPVADVRESEQAGGDDAASPPSSPGPVSRLMGGRG